MKLLKPVKRVLRRLMQPIDPQARLVKRVKAAKTARDLAPEVYNDHPRLSLLLLSFNHRHNVKLILRRLRETTAEELIVCEDGSIDGSDKVWLLNLTRPNEFLVRSNDIHEIRAYNRAAGLSRGEFVCVLQDDDIPPPDDSWIRSALALFDAHPKLAILGEYRGYVLDLEGQIDGIKVRKVYGRNESASFHWAEPIPTVDAVTRMPFMFVEGVSIGPVFYRRDVFLELGGFDPRFSAPGESGILADHEICLRAWLAGWQVGLTEPARFDKYVGGQGTLMFGSKARKKNTLSNMKRLQQDYSDKTDDINRVIDDLNRNFIHIDNQAPLEVQPELVL
jgi:glycosyltransferase involved in cell wall biosynthesis